MIKITVINCYPTEFGPHLDLIDPKAGLKRTIGPLHYNTAYAIRDRLNRSDQWLVRLSLCNGLWRATSLALLDKNCPGWREKAEINAEANRR